MISLGLTSKCAGLPRCRKDVGASHCFWVSAYFVNYFDRVNLAVSRDALQLSFGISAVMFGLPVKRLQLDYALLQLPSGLLLDRLASAA